MNSKEILIETIKAVTARYPAIVPYLRGRAGAVYCEHKATERDADEPMREQKIRTERLITRLIRQRLARQLETVREQLEMNYGKAISASGVFVGDEGEEGAELIRLLFSSLIGGALEAQADMGIYLSDGSINEPALQMARTYVTDWLRQLDETSQNAVREAIDTFISQPGTTVGDMIDLLAPTFGEARAARIAITETTRVYATANDLYAGELQSQFPGFQVVRRWFTNVDDRVCPVCAPLHNRTVGPGEDFDLGIQSPPAHVNCRCWTSVTVKA